MENFRNAPLQAINLLNKEVRIKLCQKIELNQVADEERRAGVIKEELALLREVLPKMVDNDGREKRGATGSNERKEEKAPPCPDISPALLGPLVVDQSLTTMDKVKARPTLSQPSCCRWRKSLPGLAMGGCGLQEAAGKLRPLPLSCRSGEKNKKLPKTDVDCQLKSVSLEV